MNILASIVALRLTAGADAARYYPDYGRPFVSGVCIDASPAPDGIVTYDSQLACCEGSYAGQASGACVDDYWAGSSAGGQLTCSSPGGCTGAGGGWYPDYSRSFIEGVCIDASPAPVGIVTYESQLECCEESYAGQSSGACLSSLPTATKQALPIVWFPLYAEGNCVSTEFVPRSHGVNGYETQLECCLAEYGHGADPTNCLQGLPNPPTASPTPMGGPKLDVWYPDYARGFLGGVCINDAPVPNGVIVYDSQLECCERSYAGQSSGACLSSLPTATKQALPIAWFPLYADGNCVSTEFVPRSHGVNGYETQLECCLAEYGHGADPTNCLQGLPNPPTASPTPIGGPKLDAWYPDYTRGWLDGICVNDAPAPDGVIVYDSQLKCCEQSYAGQSSGACLFSLPDPVREDLPIVWFPRWSDDTCVSTEFVPRTHGVNGYKTQLECCLAEYGHGLADPAKCFAAITASPSTALDESPPPPTPSPSPPPQDLSRRHLAAEIDKLFGHKDHASLENDRKHLREVLEDTFESIGIVEDIMDVYSDSPATGDVELSSIENGDSPGLPEAFDLSDRSLECKCIDCQEDKACGWIWKGQPSATNETYLQKLKIHIVASHCKNDLGWISDFVKGFDVASIHIVSKCGKEVLGAPETATIELLPNVGGNEHTYAHYISNVLPQRVNEDDKDGRDAVVVFLDGEADVAHLNDFESLVRDASSEHGFGCGIVPGQVVLGHHSFSLSTYHETETLRSFSVDGSYEYYDYEDGIINEHSAGHSIQYKTLQAWWNAIGVETFILQQEVVQVCYSSTFSGLVQNINRNQSVWILIEESLSRESNTRERRYAERSWASLIGTPLQPHQVEALFLKADGVHTSKNSDFHGALIWRPKVFIHIGMEGTSSTEILTDSLVDKIDLLELDGYKVAVHGKWDGGKHGFPDIDRLGSCLWNDMAKSLVPGANQCNKQVLVELSNYMKESLQESRDMVLLNPWLVRPGTAGPLSAYLDLEWDASIVIYYRRFFEWISEKFIRWREDLLDHSMAPNSIPATTFRYIDFIREYCKRLFYGKDVNEEGFPLRQLHRYDLDGKEKIELGESDWDPTTNFDLEDLTSLEEYVYFTAKQYHSQARFRRGIQIVNYHDSHGVEINFYCNVLHDAANSCNDAIQGGQQVQEKPDGLDDENNFSLAVTPSLALEDIAVKAFVAGRITFDASQPRKKFGSQILRWVEMISLALSEKDIEIEHLPVECLYNYERRRLLEASLAYEKELLPNFYASPKGASKLKEELKARQFCSVDTDAILSDPRWDFLFESASNFTLPKRLNAFVSIGGDPWTGEDLLEKSLAVDANVLREDALQYFDGQGHLAPCLWANSELQLETTNENRGSPMPNSSSCHEHLLPAFHQLLSNATAADSDVIVYDEWLSLPSSEKGLLEVLDDNFDPVVVISYRRFFDWLLMSHYQRHLIDEGAQTQRLVDFVRLICSRLFAAEMRYPGQRLVDLPQAQDYTYSSWKRYTDVPAYEGNVKILNYEDDKVVQSFYCDVLKAEKACALETERQHNITTVPAEIKGPALVPAYVELALGLNPDSDAPEDRLIELGKMYERKLAQRDLSADDLPKECLLQAELNMLLKVSLEYERILLPRYSSGGGEAEMRRHFATLVANDAFCSVDLK